MRISALQTMLLAKRRGKCARYLDQVKVKSNSVDLRTLRTELQRTRYREASITPTSWTCCF